MKSLSRLLAVSRPSLGSLTFRGLTSLPLLRCRYLHPDRLIYFAINLMVGSNLLVISSAVKFLSSSPSVPAIGKWSLKVKPCSPWSRKPSTTFCNNLAAAAMRFSSSSLLSVSCRKKSSGYLMKLSILSNRATRSYSICSRFWGIRING